MTAISEATRTDLLTWLPADLHDRVRVVPNSVRDEFSHSPKPFGHAKPVFLQVGTGWNKNLERVTEALRDVTCRLEIIGPLSIPQREALEAAQIDFVELGKVSDEQLVEAYRRCDALLFVSLFEGFGLPVIEAQAVGRPVITSRRGPLPDVAGEGALLVDPENPEELAATIRRLIAEPGLAASLVAAGLENVRRFQPEAIAEKYLGIYMELAATP